MNPIVTTDRFPIVDVCIKGVIPPGGMEGLVATYRAVSARGARFALLVDARALDASNTDARTRKRDAAVYRAASAELRASIVCEARIVHSTVARYVITAFDWLTGVPWPSASFTTPAEAEAWARRQLAQDPVYFSRASA